MISCNQISYERVLERISLERCTELTRELIRKRSVLWEEGSSCHLWIEEQLKSFGMKVKTEYLTAAQAAPDRFRVPPYPVIIGTLGGGEGKTLMFEVHYDTQVVDHSRWDCNPFAGEVVNGRIYGRGAIDSKGQMAMVMAAVEAIRTSGVELRGRLIIACMPDGEYGGSGWRYVADSGLADETDYIIGSEATYWVDKDQFQVCLAHYGQYIFEVTTVGKPTHFWRPQREGVDAIWEMEKVINALGNLSLSHEHWKWFTPRLNLMSVNSENGTNCKLTGCVFVVPGMTSRSIRKDIKTILDAVKEQDGKLDYKLLVWPRWYPSEVHENSPLVTSIIEATSAVTGKAPFKGVFELVHGGAPAIFSRTNPGQFVGKPEAVTFGAGDFRLAHIENEYADLRNLMDSARIYVRVILDLIA